MANGYHQEADDEELFPDDGQYSLVLIDEFKPPSSSDFIAKICEFDTREEVFIPSSKAGYSYYVYTTESEIYPAEEWEGSLRDLG